MGKWNFRTPPAPAVQAIPGETVLSEQGSKTALEAVVVKPGHRGGHSCSPQCGWWTEGRWQNRRSWGPRAMR